MPETTIELRLPQSFYDDHVSRDLPAGTEIRRNNKHVFVALTPADLVELRSDAIHYSDAVRHMGSDFLGIQTSAKATVQAIDAQLRGES